MLTNRSTACSRRTASLLLWFTGLTIAGVPVTLAATAIPHTPAGHALSSWLSAFNSGQKTRIDSFDRAHAPWLRGMLRLRAHTGGYDLQRIENSGRFWIIFRARDIRSSAEIDGRLVIRSYEPAHITLLSLRSADAVPTRPPIDKVVRRRVIERAATLLDTYYLYPNVARRISAKIQLLYRHGTYRNITDGEVFAIRLSDDLVAISGDKHIGVDFFARSMPNRHPRRPSRAALDFFSAHNCGFEKAEVLPGNVGYLRINSFAPVKYCARVAIAAMNFITDGQALIIDLRDNHGGSHDMVALLASYLFDKPTHLDNIEYPITHSSEQTWTLSYAPGKRFVGKPVFVLTSHETFSAAEEFAYDLQGLKRATVIGETTDGGAHLEAPHRIDSHFFIRIPFARFVNPITKTNWEDTGVKPNVKVPADKALSVAEKLATKRIRKAGTHHAGPE